MRMALFAVSLIAATLMIEGRPAAAHPGGLAADGCHNDRRNGGRHCHGGGGSASSAKRKAKKKGKAKSPRVQRLFGSADSSVYYPNCAAVRAAGAAPIRAGDPGYSRRLDRDGDGVACE